SITEGNDQADMLVATAFFTFQFDNAIRSHQFYHHNAKALMKKFQLSTAQARSIIQSCPDCQKYSSIVPEGVNPKGLMTNEIWQSDVTHIPEFGKLKYVHVTIDTFSSFISATDS
ncbi:POK6 protein, partial [Bucorvus abyssinicus]|nr:POK6 protein [Bucorvus abyssinicus]